MRIDESLLNNKKLDIKCDTRACRILQLVFITLLGTWSRFGRHTRISLSII